MKLEDMLGDDQPTYQDPYLDWCDRNQEVIRQYPNSFLAISLLTGVVIAEVSPEAFEAALHKLPYEERHGLFRTHSSLHI